MPLSELFGLSTGKLESSQKKSFPSEILSRGGNDLVELVYENGRIKMQSQSSRAAGSPARVHDPGAGHAVATRIEKFGGVQSILDDVSPVVPLGELDLSQDDEMVPWLRSCLVGDDSLPRDYGSEFLTGKSGVTGNGVSMQNSFASVERRSACDRHAVGNLQSGGDNLKASSSMAHMSCSWPSNNVSNHLDAVFGNTSIGRDAVNAHASTKVERPKTARVPLLNFSHFARLAALGNSNLPTSEAIPTSVSLGLETADIKEMGSSARANNLLESGIIGQSNGKPKDIDFLASSTKLINSRELGSQAHEKARSPGRVENFCKEIKNNEIRNASNAANLSKGVVDGQRKAEPIAASSSVCSGNGANNRVACEKRHHSKRKFCDIEDSECQSDDVETDSTGVTKPAHARGESGSKRSRAAEVHNLSERRRRDRINEKMRVLQDLVPNCSKVDKASMLDEAIEYLKTLQLQVQIMSMGAGLCMPQMMFPTGMQHMHPHFSPMGIGMGMGLGYGMAMPDMNSRTPGCPTFPAPPMHAGHFPSPMPTLNNFLRVPAPSLPIYGHPNQGLCSSVPLAGQPPVNPAVDLTGFRNESRNEAPNASPTLSCGNQIRTKKMDSTPNAEGSSLIKAQATNETSHHSAKVQDNNYATNAPDPAGRASTSVTNIIKDRSHRH